MSSPQDLLKRLIEADSDKKKAVIFSLLKPHFTADLRWLVAAIGKEQTVYDLLANKQQDCAPLQEFIRRYNQTFGLMKAILGDRYKALAPKIKSLFGELPGSTPITDVFLFQLTTESAAETTLIAAALSTAFRRNKDNAFNTVVKNGSDCFFSDNGKTLTFQIQPSFYQQINPDAFTLGTPYTALLSKSNATLTEYCQTRIESEGLSPTYNTVITTFQGLGKGNLYNALRMVCGLAKGDPATNHLWCLATQNPLPQDVIEELAQYPNIKLLLCYSLYEVWPIILKYSKKAKVVFAAPNAFAPYEEKRLGFQFNDNPNGWSLIDEYNCPIDPENSLAHNRITPIPAGLSTMQLGTMGIYKPNPVRDCPGNEKEWGEFFGRISELKGFQIKPGLPLYFNYVYNHKPGEISSVRVLSTIDLIALAVIDAREKGLAEINISIPVNADEVSQCLKAFPKLFAGVAIDHQSEKILGSGSGTEAEDTPPQDQSLVVHVFNPIPLANTDLRLLMEYGIRSDTFVCATGDQSFIELFFNKSQNFVFLYQLLDHKKPLLKALTTLLKELGLVKTLELLQRTEGFQSQGEHNHLSEKQLSSIHKLISTNRDALKEETAQLATHLREEQPDLADSLTELVKRAIAGKAPAAMSHHFHPPTTSSKSPIKKKKRKKKAAAAASDEDSSSSLKSLGKKDV